MTTQKDFPFQSGDEIIEVSARINNERTVKVYRRGRNGIESQVIVLSVADSNETTPPKKTIRLYPALIDIGASMNIWRVDWDNLFQNEEEANRHFGCQFFKWPASESLFVDVTVEDE